MFEHAYYHKDGPGRATYIDSFIKNLHWAASTSASCAAKNSARSADRRHVETRMSGASPSARHASS
ncbi:MAG: hypothetical protein JW889_03610 [Verrucomicrobia bacterium]|nr:hypothetical protein [Verrucomicrobiota bacterium]